MEATLSEALMNSIPLAVLAVDEDGLVLDLNQAARGLVSPEVAEPLGQRLDTLIPDLSPLLAELDHHEAGFQREIRFGESTVAQVTVTAMPGHGWSIALYDVSAYKKDSYDKNRLLGEVTHDLKQPLAAILSFSDLVKAAGELTPKQNQFLERIRTAASRMAEQVHQLLDVAWIESGMKLTPGDVNLLDLVKATLEEAEPRAADKQIQLKLVAPDSLPALVADNTRLRQVITNLVNNAIKYSKKKTTITVTVAEQAGQLALSVKDQGFGIAPEHLPHLFERFYRVKSEHTRTIEGTGLGLYISHSIVEQHGGHIDVESEPGVGSTFTIRLPLKLQAQQSGHFSDKGS